VKRDFEVMILFLYLNLLYISDIFKMHSPAAPYQPYFKLLHSSTLEVIY